MIISQALADLIEQSEMDYMTDRMEAIRAREGNPEGVEVKRFGLATAFYSRTMPWGLFNNVKGKIEEENVEEIITFYRERGRNFEIQVTPGKVNPAVLKELAYSGFYQSGFHTSLYCEARKEEPDHGAEVEIREFRPEEMDTYAEIHCLGTGLSIEGKPYVAANNEVLFMRPGWRFYIALYNKIPASVAVMYMQEDAASLTFAATLPEYRNKGLQRNLLLKRIDEAYRNGCQWVVGQCAYCSASHRNMERAGMKIGYTRATWTKL